MAYLDLPARVLECFVVESTGIESWPYDDGSSDPYWEFGTSPRDYQWRVELTISPQRHSSHRTRVPKVYNGMDVKVGDYIANSNDGTAVRIICIESKADDRITCIVEDVFRYNTFRDHAGLGNGMMTVPCTAIIFSTNHVGMPTIDPLPPSAVDSLFYPNLMSRFQNREGNQQHRLHKEAHGFAEGQMISADSSTNSFALTSSDYPFVIGRVSYVANEDEFFVSPIQKIADDLDYLPGDVGDIIYADSSEDTGLTTTVNANPVLIKLREESQSVATSSVANATTTANAIISLNGVIHTIPTGTQTAFANVVNTHSSVTGVSAAVVLVPTTITTSASLLSSSFGEPLFDLTSVNPIATINGTVVHFETSEDGNNRYGEPYATPVDMARDINDAFGRQIAVGDGPILTLTFPEGGGIDIVNNVEDSLGQGFAGVDSASGVPISTAGSLAKLVRLTAVDARPIDLSQIAGSLLDDFGLFSVENGTKAAGLWIEQGIRQSTNTVVADIAARNGLLTILGDTAHVIDKGDGEWGQYVFDGTSWKTIATQESSESEGHTLSSSIMVDNNQESSSTVVLGEIPSSSKIVTVSANVTDAFNANAVLTVGQSGDVSSLFGDSHADLTQTGVYLITPQKIFASDTIVNVYISNAISGSVTVSVIYQ